MDQKVTAMMVVGRVIHAAAHVDEIGVEGGRGGR
jgi:hypothetical protein